MYADQLITEPPAIPWPSQQVALPRCDAARPGSGRAVDRDFLWGPGAFLHFCCCHRTASWRKTLLSILACRMCSNVGTAMISEHAVSTPWQPCVCGSSVFYKAASHGIQAQGHAQFNHMAGFSCLPSVLNSRRSMCGIKEFREVNGQLNEKTDPLFGISYPRYAVYYLDLYRLEKDHISDSANLPRPVSLRPRTLSSSYPPVTTSTLFDRLALGITEH